MINILKNEDKLILKYTIDADYFFQNRNWIEERLENNESFKISKIFKISSDLELKKNEDNNEDFKEYNFTIGYKEGSKYKIINEVLEIEYDCYLTNDIDINIEHFLSGTKVNIIQKIINLTKEDLLIGNEEGDNLSSDDFENLIKLFPNNYEINLYRDSRITAVLRNFFDNVPDKKNQYERYLEKKPITQKEPNLEFKKLFSENEIIKYEIILIQLKEMLESEDKYNENDWQNEIVDIISLVFPKYIKVIKELKFTDTNSKNRRLDFGLIDFDGNLDILEIKKSANISILNKGLYRDNFIANRDLIGSIMQIEKYIYYLNKGGNQLLSKLNKKYLPEIGLEINITNPKGIIILGRSINFNSEQKSDFEIIKRKYNNIVDILTYDNLIDRIEKIINSFKIVEEK
ncbi:Shedu immune nuclease family protein [Flavobacterium sp. PL002]|uniref:Shedu immune nuclease family protein n=1 Tax=Flavobacterium sp. PL002 TaxID=1897058 RepID=UPI001787EBB1|nr:Shedu immune nuclease family protein [Flavobacterium sp. PL002]MBE0393695.1 hypothetical protein [Flavobacterium sp. PL002]